MAEQPARPPEPPRDPQAVARFQEGFASELAEAGMPRMPSRVFVALLVSDSGTLTAAELGERLQISPAAVSGAVRYLAQVGMIAREREPGSRRERYRLHGDQWYETVVRRDQLLIRWENSVRSGMEALGPDTAAGARLAETAAFFHFLREEMGVMLGRWREYRRTLEHGTDREDRTDNPDREDNPSNPSNPNSPNSPDNPDRPDQG